MSRGEGATGERPRMLLNNLQCIRQSPPQRTVQLKESTGLKLKNSILTKDEIVEEWVLPTESAVKIENNL